MNGAKSKVGSRYAMMLLNDFNCEVPEDLMALPAMIPCR